jgi:CrcB protein
VQAPAARHDGPVQADVLLAVALGGAVGALLRYALGRLAGPSEQGWPWATFAENLSGSPLLGALLVAVVERGRGHRLARPFLGVGVLGSFTTMSAYGVETQQLLLADRPALAAAYAVCTLVGALLAVLVGVRVTRGLVPQAEP